MAYETGVGLKEGKPRDMTLSENISSFEGHLGAARDLLSRVSAVADRIGGSIPREPTKGQDCPPDHSLNRGLAHNLGELGNLHAAISMELGRLEGAI